MAANDIAGIEDREKKAWLLQRHLLDLSTVLEIANNNKLRAEDTSRDAALDVIDNIFDRRYGRSGEPDEQWFVSFRVGRRPRNRAAWAGLKTRSKLTAWLNRSQVEVFVDGKWVPEKEHRAPVVPQYPTPSGPTGQERYDAARRSPAKLGVGPFMSAKRCAPFS